MASAASSITMKCCWTGPTDVKGQKISRIVLLFGEVSRQFELNLSRVRPHEPCLLPFTLLEKTASNLRAPIEKIFPLTAQIFCGSNAAPEAECLVKLTCGLKDNHEYRLNIGMDESLSVKATLDKIVHVELPVRGDNKAKWESLGIEWAASLEGDPFYVMAKLPFGWNHQFCKGGIVILDPDQIPRAKLIFGEWGGIGIGVTRQPDVQIFSYAEQVELKRQYDQLLAAYNRAYEELDDFARKQKVRTTHLEFASRLPNEFKDDDKDGICSIQ